MNAQGKSSVWPPTRFLAIVGAASFIASAAVLAPASFLAPALSDADASVSYERLEGRIWRGKIVRLNVGEHYLGDIDFSVSPWQLALGRLRASVTASGGAGEGRGVVAYGVFDQSLRISDADVAFDLASVRRYSIFGLPYQGDLRAAVDSLVWTKKGCRAADVEIWTDLLDASSRRLVGEGMELAGAAVCDGAKLALTLHGENSEGQTEIVVNVTPDMTYQLIASVSPTRRELQESLKRLGFEDNGASLVYDAMGAIRGLGS